MHLILNSGLKFPIVLSCTSFGNPFLQLNLFHCCQFSKEDFDVRSWFGWLFFVSSKRFWIRKGIPTKQQVFLSLLQFHGIHCGFLLVSSLCMDFLLSCCTFPRVEVCRGIRSLSAFVRASECIGPGGKLHVTAHETWTWWTGDQTPWCPRHLNRFISKPARFEQNFKKHSCLHNVKSLQDYLFSKESAWKKEQILFQWG